MRSIAVLALAACGGAPVARTPIASLRAACGAGQYWDGRACARTGDAPQKLEQGKQALAALQVDQARAALDAAEKAGPLGHDDNVTLWEQRGIAAAYVDDEAGAKRAFDMLLALDPGHFLSYKLSPKATFVFEQVRAQKDRAAPELDITWQRGGKVGDPVPLDVEVLADPMRLMRRATVFVRERGQTAWRAADLALPDRGDARLVLPPLTDHKPVSLELYLEAYDEHGNEVLGWATPTRPREIPLRYDPPPPWYKTWWGITAMIGAGVAIAAVTAYEVTLSPPDKIDGGGGLAK
ncbi:MAG TPA: hypothetical protein VLX92_14450 [Kofleriaceae bacterium]|nr:hypothetical protein [Kofleriaceae bacterium]